MIDEPIDILIQVEDVMQTEFEKDWTVKLSPYLLNRNIEADSINLLTVGSGLFP